MNLSFKSRILRKILNRFFLNEQKKYYINELARQIEEDTKNVYRYLLQLEHTGVLKSEFSGKERYFSANRKNSLYSGYKKIFLKNAGIEIFLKDVLRNIRGIEEVYIFGSYPNNNYRADSDIDLLIVGDHDIMVTQRQLNKIQKNTGCEINAVNMTKKEIKEKKNNRDQFIRGIFNKKTIKIL